MNCVIHLSEIIGTIDEGETEVCATADAKYDVTQARVSVTLDAFARRVSAAPALHPVLHEWLPQQQMVMEHVPREDASAFARDVFHTWTRKVREAVPTDLHLIQA